ncbi:hypothetical protein SLS60_011744 [Paraconiothyrium brasiliense]|uniref:Uncharacterized protein n=1 Tax=Paraconiothyrium brasiliense TaxID=300254 RepID=A0ABR3QHV3_9PLEO
MAFSPSEYVLASLRANYVKDEPICHQESEDLLEALHDYYRRHPNIRKFGKELHLNENTIYFRSTNDLKWWTGADDPRRFLLRRIIVDEDIPFPATKFHTLDEMASLLNKLPNLEEVTIGIDEMELVRNWSRERNGQQEIDFRPEDIGFQLNLIMLPAVHKLRQLRFRKVTFSDMHKEIDFNYRHDGAPQNTYKWPRGPIPGGVLETLIAPEMMPPKDPWVPPPQSLSKSPSQNPSQSPSRKRKREDETPDEPNKFFRFLDLPNELRNHVYEDVLVQKGAINPSLRIPSSQRYYRHKWRQAPPRLPSVLESLRVNKRIYGEAVRIYYSHNDFIFYAPTQFLGWHATIGHIQRAALERIGIWCYEHGDGGSVPAPTVFTMVMHQLKTLRNLKKLTLFLPVHQASMILKDPTYLDFEHIEDLRALRRRGVEIEIRCPEADRRLWVAENQVWQGTGPPAPKGPQVLAFLQKARRLVDLCNAMVKRINRDRVDTPLPSPTSSIDQSESESESESSEDDDE